MNRTTTEEFKDALKLVMACRANLNCGVYMSENDMEDADWLYCQCELYCGDYRRFLNREH